MKKYPLFQLRHFTGPANSLGILTMFLLFFGFSAHKVNAQDAYLQNLQIGRYIKTNTNYSISYSVRNAVSSPALTSFRIGWRWNNGSISYSQQINMGGGGINQNNLYNHTHPASLNVATQGAGTLKVWVEGQGDNNHANDTITIKIKVISNFAEKNVLAEVKTATWCQYCPAANVLANTMNQDPRAIVVKLHSEDGLSSANATAYLSQNMNVNFTPAIMIDQGEYGSYVINSQHPGWQGQIDARKLGVSPASVQINPTYNTSNRQLTVQVVSTILHPEAGEYRINAYILEDNVSGPQTNGGSGNNYIHNQILREILGPVSGTTGVIPQNPVQGQAYTHTYTHTLPASWNPAKIRIVAYITHVENGQKYTLNANKAGLGSMGIDHSTLNGSEINIYPNPFTYNLSIDFSKVDPSPYTIELFNPDGRLMQSWNFSGGNTSFELNKLESLPAGSYYVRIGNSGNHIVRKIIKQ